MSKLSVFAFMGFATIGVSAFSAAANAQCPSTPLTNGTPADATQVMAWLNCKAPVDNAWLGGNVGIGTGTPRDRLDVKMPVNHYAYFGGSTAGERSVKAGQTIDGYAAIQGVEWASGAARDLSLQMDGSNVGIGTGTPRDKLDVKMPPNHYAFIGGSTGGERGVKIGQTITGYAAIQGVEYSAGTAKDLSLQMEGGYLGVNTLAPRALLELSGTVSAAPNADAIWFTNTSSGSTGRNWLLGNGAGPNFADLAFMVSTSSGGTPGGTPVLNLSASGKVGINTATSAQALTVAGTIRQTGCTTAGTLSTNTSGDIICTSDARLKNILGAYAGGLDSVMRLAPQRFTYKPTPNNPVETFVHAGFIAQNVRKVIPEAVAVQKSGYYSLDTTAVLATAVNAIKELKATNDVQAAELGRLRAENAALAGQLKLQEAAVQNMRNRLSAVERRTVVHTAENQTTNTP